VIKFVSDLQQVGGFLRILRFPLPKKLAATGCPKKIFVCVFCFAPEIGIATHRYAGTITVNLELDSASNDIYFLNMQLTQKLNACVT
jgi:hypothetical protein